MLTDFQFANAIMDVCALEAEGIRDLVVAVIRGDAPLQSLITTLTRWTDHETMKCILSFLNISVDI